MKIKYISSALVILVSLIFISPPYVNAATTKVGLGTADNFAVLVGSAISDSVTSVINGDVGLSPGGGASITGLKCSEMATGTIYDNDGGYTGNGGGSTACRTTNAGLLTTAQNDLTAAYNNAAARIVTSTIATDLAGAVLTDGVYHSASGTFSITGGGTVTLDGQGNADSVFIFKADSTFITSSASRVVLINGAQACNVFWQVGSAATLGTGTTLSGNILASAAITDNGGSTVNGRLLTNTAGAITLSNSHVTRQTCSSGSSGSSAGLSSSLSSGSGGSSSGDQRVCPVLKYVTPIIIESRRVSENSIFINWGPYSGINTFNVRYGLANGNWLYSTNVTGFSTTINDLPPNQPIWIQVAATDGCSLGTYSEAFLVRNPILPNAGLGPTNNNSTWYILAEFFALSLISLGIFLKKHSVEEANRL